MAAMQKRLGSYLIGLYFWVLTIYFGMTLLDIFYARLAPDAVSAFRQVSDILLMFNFVILLSAFVMLAIARKFKNVQNLIITSQLILFLEFLIPAFVSLVGLNLTGSPIGPWLRIIPGAAASIVALVAMLQYNQQK